MRFIHVGKEAMSLLFCLNKSRLRIWPVYISYVMLTIALRVKGNKIPAISFYWFKIDYFCHEMILEVQTDSEMVCVYYRMDCSDLFLFRTFCTFVI
jgi:hypothetical protein